MEEPATSASLPATNEGFSIKRHPVGLVVIIAESILAVVALAALGIIAAPDYLSSLSDGQLSAIASVTVLVIGLIALFTFVASVVYRRNKIIVSDHDLEEINQRSLLVRKVSRLEMNDVEDVHCDQKGLLQTVLGYGTLTIQTAGARDNFVFTYCPRPDFYAQKILEARSRYLSHHPAA